MILFSIMPPGVPHWVMGTSNAICVGRHFYAASTIRLSVVTIVHTFVLDGAVTNASHQKTRTLLYQLLVFWSFRLDQTDVDGKFNFQMQHSRSNLVIIVKGPHIPAISSVEGFFDILHLEVFIILSTAFDNRFYESGKCPPTLIDEVAYARRHFYSILHQVFQRFHILLDGVGVSVMYVVERMLAEFAAASVVLAKNLPGDQVGDNIDFSTFIEHIKGILK